MGPRHPAPRAPLGAPLSAAAPGPMRGGVLLAYEREGVPVRAFVPAEVALRLTALGAMTEVPGARLPARGIALADGEVVTVLELGRPPPRGAEERYTPHDEWPVPGADRALLCLIGAQKVALIGGRVLSTGVFEQSTGDDGVIHRGELVRTLDVRALYAQAETAIWAPRPGTPAAARESGGSTR